MTFWWPWLTVHSLATPCNDPEISRFDVVFWTILILMNTGKKWYFGWRHCAISCRHGRWHHAIVCDVFIDVIVRSCSWLAHHSRIQQNFVVYCVHAHFCITEASWSVYLKQRMIICVNVLSLCLAGFLLHIWLAPIFLVVSCTSTTLDECVWFCLLFLQA